MNERRKEGRKEGTKEGNLFVRSPPRRSAPPHSRPPCRSRSFSPGAKSWLNCELSPRAAKCQKQEVSRRKEGRKEVPKSKTFRGIYLHYREGLVLAGSDNNFLIERAIFIKYVFLRSSSRVLSCSCIRERIIGPPSSTPASVSLQSPFFRFCMSVS